MPASDSVILSEASRFFVFRAVYARREAQSKDLSSM